MSTTWQNFSPRVSLRRSWKPFCFFAHYSFTLCTHFQIINQRETGFSRFRRTTFFLDFSVCKPWTPVEIEKHTPFHRKTWVFSVQRVLWQRRKGRTREHGAQMIWTLFFGRLEIYVNDYFLSYRTVYSRLQLLVYRWFAIHRNLLQVDKHGFV